MGEEKEPQPCRVQLRQFAGKTTPDWRDFWQFGRKKKRSNWAERTFGV